MAEPAIEESLRAAESAVASGEGLSGTGFWQAVATVKGQPELVDRYSDRIAAIDTAAHRNWAILVLPLRLGTTIALLVVLAGLVLVAWAYFLEGTAAVVSFLAGAGILIGATHGLGHLVVGRLLGIRFDYWFVGEIRRPQPGLKVDYVSYLRATPRRRAWMHAAGALTTKVMPFLLIGAAVAAGLPPWVSWALAGLGVVMILLDVFWSSKASDWKKFKRELEFAQS